MSSHHDVESVGHSSSNAESGSSQSSTRSRYVPPHLRGRPQSDRAPTSERQAADSSPERQSDNQGSRGPSGRPWSDAPRSNRDNPRDRPERSERSDRPPREEGGNRRWNEDRRPARRNPMERDMRLEAELFGESKQTTGINFKNYEDIPVETNGDDVPEPITHFRDIKFHDLLEFNIGLAGYEIPTPVQKNGLPISLNGRDLMACAQTGSGKTAAFLLPVIQMLLTTDRASSGGEGMYSRRKVAPGALVLAPTRELATQIWKEARKFCYRTHVHPVVVYGGQDIRNQLRDLERGCDLLVATPGRLADLLDRGRISLHNIRFLVFDEADRMLDMGFEPQIREIVEKNGMPVEGRQTLMFSATFPREIQRLAQDFLDNYIFLAVGRVGSTTDFITQKVEAGGSEAEKFDRLMSILSKCEGLTLIFVETKRAADMLERDLCHEGIEATSIHGDRSQGEREHALAMFRCGRCPVLVATDVASRGLDIPDVRCVVNFDLPTNIEDYVHRIGRTGRCGNVGTAISFVSEKNKPILRELSDMMKENNQECPAWFDSLVASATGFGGSYGRRGGGRGGSRGGSRFGARDFRKGGYDDQDSFSSSSSSSFSSRAPAPSRSFESSRSSDRPASSASSRPTSGWGSSSGSSSGFTSSARKGGSYADSW